MTRAILAFVALAGCSSHYFPRSRGRVATTIQDGKVVYVRDGRTYEHGLLGGGLVDVVAGNPAAVAAATEYHDRVVTGLVTAILGGVALGAGGSWLARDAVANTQNVDMPLIVAAAGIVLMLIGTTYAATAETYRWDAINLFNDGADEPSQFAAPPGWHASLHKETLRMGD